MSTFGTKPKKMEKFNKKAQELRELLKLGSRIFADGAP
jgi:hypothetical protein